MLLRQQFNAPLPERPRGVHEMRAALMSMYLHTDPRGDASYALTPAMQPLSLPSAIQTIHDLPPEYQRSGLQHATFRLASAVFVEGSKEFRPDLQELLGGDRLGRDQLAGFEGRISISTPDNALNIPTYETIRRIVYGQGDRLTQRGADVQEPLVQPRIVERPFFLTQAAPVRAGPESTLDLVTLTTTVNIPSTSNLPFDQLATALDPRNWTQSPFWQQSVQVEPDESGTDFTLTTRKPQLGQPWDGFLFEHVEWNWNTSTVSSFRNFLKLGFQVDVPKQTIDMTFSLHSCEGSQLYALVSKRGVDIDFGIQSVQPPGPDGAGLLELRTQKNIRFSDTLNRRTSFEGGVGSGALLVYLAPALVGLWMNDLLSHINA
jgi:hypothetical protein